MQIHKYMSNKLKQNRLAKIRANNIGFIFQGFNLIPSLNALEKAQEVYKLANGSYASDLKDLDVDMYCSKENIYLKDVVPSIKHIVLPDISHDIELERDY